GKLIDVAGGSGAFEVRGEVPGVALPWGELHPPAVEAAGGQHRLRDRVGAHRTRLAIEIVSEHDRPSLHRCGEAPVEVQAWAKLRVRRAQLRQVTREAVERVDARARIVLRPQDVERDQRDAVTLEQLVHELRHEVAAPRPVAYLAEALLVDVEDDDA